MAKYESKDVIKKKVRVKICELIKKVGETGIAEEDVLFNVLTSHPVSDDFVLSWLEFLYKSKRVDYDSRGLIYWRGN